MKRREKGERENRGLDINCFTEISTSWIRFGYFYNIEMRSLQLYKSPGVILILLFTFFLCGPLTSRAQKLGTETFVRSLQADQQSFSELVRMMFLDTMLTESLLKFSKSDVDSLRDQILADSSISEDEKAKAIQSIGLFIHGIRLRLAFNKVEWYDIPAAMGSYKLLLNAILYRKPYSQLIEPLSQMRTRLLAHAFEHFSEYDHLIDLARYKSIESTPADIINFLELHPNFQFFDSLLLFTAAHDPEKMAVYVRDKTTELSKVIRSHKNKYVQQIVALSGDRDASELLPFVVQLADNRITRSEILQKRKEASGYFQLLVNTLKDFHTENRDKGNYFHQALHNAIKARSLSFYVNQLNELHEAPKDVRFASIRDLRMEDLYYIMTSAGNELYTSSYLGLYRRLMEYCKKNSTDSLFRIVHYDKFRDFMRIAANYNTLSDFFSCFAEETTHDLLKRYIKNIEEDTYTGLEKAMDVADCFAGLSSDSAFSELIRKELILNYERCRNQDLVFGEKLYDILLRVFNLVQRKAGGNNGSSWEGYNEKLERTKLENEKGEIIGLVLFYGDEDGRTSLKNFRALFKDAGKWQVEESKYWIRIRSRKGIPLILYANQPLDHETYLDIQAQDSLSAYLKQQSLEPVILIHRGHSYYINYTMRKMEESVMLAILGACGGNNYILDIASINPDVQMVISKKIGAMTINDPIIEEVCNALVNKKDLIWMEIWNELESRFKTNPAMLALFKEYIPPPNNISIFVLNLFDLER